MLYMKKVFFSIFCTVILNANEAISLNEALDLLNSQNLEIKAARLDVNAANEKADTVSGNNWGKLDLIQDVVNSDSAGNVFGFKLESREATFGDFGFNEFIANMDTITPTSPTFDGGKSLLATAPDDLNYPEARTHFQTKLKYEVPLFTGFQISSYTNIMESMAKMKELDKDKVVNEKIYQLKKVTTIWLYLRTL